MRSLLLVILGISGIWTPVGLAGQTCCSGGVPLSSNLGLPPEEGRTLQINVNYDMNVLQTLKSGREVLQDDSRTRRTHSILLQTGYSLTDRFSVDALFSWVRQERAIRQFGNEDFTATNGLGDAVFLLKYKLITISQNQTVVTGAVGVKAPLGPSDLRRDDGLTINADLQPGSGAWDGVFWLQGLHNLGVRPSMSFSTTAVYAAKGKNKDYLDRQVYQFGNEFQLITGVSDRLLIGKAVIDPSVSLRFRHVLPNRLQEQDVPSTGGKWLFFTPSASYWINAGNAVTLKIEWPLFVDITGTQVSPTYRLNIGFYRNVSFKKRQLPGVQNSKYHPFIQ